MTTLKSNEYSEYTLSEYIHNQQNPRANPIYNTQVASGEISTTPTLLIPVSESIKDYISKEFAKL